MATDTKKVVAATAGLVIVVGGVVAGVKLLPSHPVVGGIAGFLGGNIVAGLAMEAISPGIMRMRSQQ